MKTTYYCPACQAAFSTHWPFGSYCDCGCEKLYEIDVKSQPCESGEPVTQFVATFVYDEPVAFDAYGATRVEAIDALIARAVRS